MNTTSESESSDSDVESMYVEVSFGVLFVQEEDNQQKIKIKFGMRESMWGRTLGGGGGGVGEGE